MRPQMARARDGQARYEMRRTERTECMLELIPANKTEHPRFAIHVCVEDREPRIRVASPDESGELIAQGAHRVRVPNVDHLYVAISLWEDRRFGQVICEKEVVRSNVRHR